VTPTERDRYLHLMRLTAESIISRCHGAVAQLEQSAGGYRATVIGAAPATTNGWHGDPDPDPGDNTVVEAQAFRTDQARDALRQSDAELAKAVAHLTVVDRIYTANWVPSSEASRHAAAIREQVDDLWCTNHRRHKIYEPKGQESSLCDWCSEIRKPVKDGGFGHLPDAELIEARHRRGKGYVNARDLEQFADRKRRKMSADRKNQRDRSKGAA
jgi:hypothetical protein